jgi:hypothetical protein
MQDDKHYRENDIICPYCDYVFTDSWEFDGDNDTEEKTTCGRCEKEFKVTRNIDVSYTTTVMLCDEIGEQHEYKIIRYLNHKNKDTTYSCYRVETCDKCTNTDYIKITQEEYEKNKNI